MGMSVGIRSGHRDSAGRGSQLRQTWRLQDRRSFKAYRVHGQREVRSITIPDELDPADIALDVSLLMEKELSIDRNEAMSLFIRSRTFRRVRTDDSMLRMVPREILEMYLEEVGNDGPSPAISRTRI